MLDTLGLVGAGFSLIVAPMLFVVYAFFIRSLNKSWVALLSCFILLLGLGGLQFGHWQFFMQGDQAFEAWYYRLCIFSVPPAFYYFSRVILFPDMPLRTIHLIHLGPLAFVFFKQYEILVILSFVLGLVYCLWLSSILYRVRHLRKRFREEFFFFGLFSLIAIVVLVIGALSSVSHTDLFYYVYANSISFSLVLVVFLLLAVPNVVEELNEAISLGYVNSTLGNVDVNSKLETLETLMQEQKLYQNENLSLATVAEALELSGHQVSELINTHFGSNFSRFIRKKRIDAACELLRAEREVSILSISMEVGFRSQSAFYAAFKDELELSPGQYRQQAIQQT